jgi:hypothetical protein
MQSIEVYWNSCAFYVGANEPIAHCWRRGGDQEPIETGPLVS